MKRCNFINYQGSKSNIINFITESIGEYTKEGDVILDIFSGSGSVSNALKHSYTVYANDVEPFAATLAEATLLNYELNEEIIDKILLNAIEHYNFKKTNTELSNYIQEEKKIIKRQDIDTLVNLYNEYPTVWNTKTITPACLRKNNDYNLFINYYAGSYFGISQSLEIDSLIYSIHQNDIDNSLLYACLFYAIKESVFSRDGHMAQPLNLKKYPERAFSTRARSVFECFKNKALEVVKFLDVNDNNHMVFNEDFISIISNETIMNNIDLIYADPPYTDMQYSRYYHILNIAKNYNYPDLTKTSQGYTTGLYTEGRFQSELSKKSKAKENLDFLMQQCVKYNVNLALSYAYPRNSRKQATNRYTVSIEELIKMAKKHFGSKYVKINQLEHVHANNKNRKGKKVIEYLIICGANKYARPEYNIDKIKSKILEIKPTNRNPMYNSHLYWSQKAYNVNEVLIQNLSEPGDVIFDPFMGSGVTIFESIKKGVDRTGIGCDVNEMPVFFTTTLLDSVFAKDINLQIKQFGEEVLKINKYYQILCPNCNKDAIIERVIFDKLIRTSNEIEIKVVNIVCEKCGKIVSDENLELIKHQMYKEYSYDNVNSEKKLIQNSKIAVGENDKISDIFTNRNLKVIDEILNLSKRYSPDMQRIVKYLLASVMHQCKITDKRSNSQWPLWIPKKDCVERNIISLVTRKISHFNKAIKYVKENYFPNSLVSCNSELARNKALILNKGSQNITEKEIPNNSVDLIITDPPYLEQVLYSEYMQLYWPTLGLSYNLEDEIIVSSAPSRDKDKDNYFALMKEVFELCSRKLKIGSYMCLYFHNSSLAIWNDLISILYESGFKYISQVHIKKNVTLKNIISPKKSLRGDSILFFVNSGLKVYNHEGTESIEEIESNIVKEAKYMIKTQGPLTTPELYDNGLIEILIHNGWLKPISEKYNSLIDIFEKYLHWDRDIGKWKLNSQEDN